MDAYSKTWTDNNNNIFALYQHFLIAIWINGGRLESTNDRPPFPDDPHLLRRLVNRSRCRPVLLCADGLNGGKVFPTGARMGVTFH